MRMMVGSSHTAAAGTVVLLIAREGQGKSSRYEVPAFRKVEEGIKRPRPFARSLVK